MLYEKITAEGDLCRRSYVDGIKNYIERKNREGFAEREAFMPASDFKENIEAYRKQFTDMLGIGKIDSDNCPEPALELCGEDEDCIIYRATVFITKEIPMYGILMLPHGIKKAPLIIGQHGGGGTPELCSDMLGKNNYNKMVRRLLKRGAAVFAPQLLLWNLSANAPQPVHNIPYSRAEIDKMLKRFGCSITALEIKGIMNCITFLSTLDYIDEDKIGMMGVSYGGYFTMHTMAADTRIKAGYSNAVFNDRSEYPFSDWCYQNSANTFHDAEVAALCAPRRLYISVGTEDSVFDYKTAIPEAERASKYFEAFGCPNNFSFNVWQGGHTVPNTDEGYDFLFNALK